MRLRYFPAVRYPLCPSFTLPSYTLRHLTRQKASCSGIRCRFVPGFSLRPLPFHNPFSAPNVNYDNLILLFRVQIRSLPVYLQHCVVTIIIIMIIGAPILTSMRTSVNIFLIHYNHIFYDVMCQLSWHGLHLQWVVGNEIWLLRFLQISKTVFILYFEYLKCFIKCEQLYSKQSDVKVVLTRVTELVCLMDCFEVSYVVVRVVPIGPSVDLSVFSAFISFIGLIQRIVDSCWI